jgi:hypothetical protein
MAVPDTHGCRRGRPHEIPTGFAAVRRGAGNRVARPWVADRTGSAGILRGQSDVWANMCKKNPLGFWARPAAVRRKSSRARRRGEGLAGDEGQQPRPESSLYKARWDSRLAKTRRKQDFRPGAGARRRGGAARMVARRRVHIGSSAWGHPAARRVRARTWGGPSPPKIGALPHCPAALGDSAMAVLRLALTAAGRSKKGGFRPAASKGAPLDGGRVSRGTAKASPLPPRARALRQPRGKTAVAWRADTTTPGVWVTRAKGPTFTQRAQAQRRTGTRWASKRARVHARVTATAAAETATATRRLRWLSRKGNQEPENGRGCARGDDRGGTCKIFFPAWLDSRHHQRRARRRSDSQGDPAPDSMVGPHRGKEGSFLTSVATGRRSCVGEEIVDATKRKAAAPVGEAESRRGEEEGDARDDPVWLPLLERLQLCDGNGPTGGLSCLLLLLTSPAAEWGGESPVG